MGRVFHRSGAAVWIFVAIRERWVLIGDIVAKGPHLDAGPVIVNRVPAEVRAVAMAPVAVPPVIRPCRSCIFPAL